MEHTTTARQYQHTLKHPVFCSGTGLHSGRTVRLGIHPAPENSGITFERADLPNAPLIPARFDAVGATMLATTLSAPGDKQARISTVEHLMAALSGLGMDNARVTVDCPEVPIMDGSAAPFVEALDKAGRERQNAPRRYLRVTRPFGFEKDGKRVAVEPADEFRVSCAIDFDAELIRRQRYETVVTPENFRKEIARARTFGYVEQVEELLRQGLALGGTLDNVVAIHWNRRSVLNEGGLRYKDEFVRHKMLDLVGDAALAGAPILGRVTAERSGHQLHHEFLKALFSHPDCWEYVPGDKLGGLR